MNRAAFQTTIALTAAMMLLWVSSPLAGARMLYSDDGLSEITVPGERWLVRPHVGRTAALRVTDTQGDRKSVV